MRSWERQKYRGEDVYTHVVFAEKVLDLAKRAKIEATTTLGLFTLRDNLPEVLQEKVAENQTSWISFVNAIKSVELGHIREGVWKHRDKQVEADRIQSQFKLLEQCTVSNTTLLNSPTKSICDQFNRVTISQPALSGADLFLTNAGGHGNIFNTPARPNHPAAITQTGMTQLQNIEEIAVIRDSIALYPMQPGMDKGWTVYHEQMNTWLQRNGNICPTKATGFPICPGGTQPGSAECFRCGTVGHHRGACKSKHIILKYKGNFLAICGSILSIRHQPLQVNFVAAETEEFS